MKLIIGIINSDDSSDVSSALTKKGFYVTKLASTGGFLKKGNVTFLIGTDDDKVDECVEVIKANARRRTEKEPAISPSELGEVFSPVMIDVVVGGATIFVLPIENFMKF